MTKRFIFIVDKKHFVSFWNFFYNARIRGGGARKFLIIKFILFVCLVTLILFRAPFMVELGLGVIIFMTLSYTLSAALSYYGYIEVKNNEVLFKVNRFCFFRFLATEVLNVEDTDWVEPATRITIDRPFINSCVIYNRNEDANDFLDFLKEKNRESSEQES